MPLNEGLRAPRDRMRENASQRRTRG